VNEKYGSIQLHLLKSEYQGTRTYPSYLKRLLEHMTSLLTKLLLSDRARSSSFNITKNLKDPNSSTKFPGRYKLDSLFVYFPLSGQELLGYLHYPNNLIVISYFELSLLLHLTKLIAISFPYSSTITLLSHIVRAPFYCSLVQHFPSFDSLPTRP
jgi:hypothetical protein